MLDTSNRRCEFRCTLTTPGGAGIDNIMAHSATPCLLPSQLLPGWDPPEGSRPGRPAFGHKASGVSDREPVLLLFFRPEAGCPSKKG